MILLSVSKWKKSGGGVSKSLSIKIGKYHKRKHKFFFSKCNKKIRSFLSVLVSVLLPAWVERFSVSRILILPLKKTGISTIDYSRGGIQKINHCTGSLGYVTF